MIPPGADASTRVEVLRRVLFTAGAWNDNRPFTHDMTDPYGRKPGNKLLSDYLADRRGNCVTMPVLMIILGQRIGLDMTAASAPLHVLVRFRDDAGKLWNLQATSGGFPARDQHYRDLLPIPDRAMETADKGRGPCSADRSGHSPAVATRMRWPSPGSASTIIPCSCRPWRAGAAPPIC